jgi:hypothetical protein
MTTTLVIPNFDGYTKGERWGAVVSTPTLLSRIAEGLASFDVSWEPCPNSNSMCNTLWFFADKVEAGATRCLEW